MKTLVFTLWFTFIAHMTFSQCNNFKGLYVNNFYNPSLSTSILGNSTAESCLFNYAVNNGFNYFVLYNINDLSTDISTKHFNNTTQIDDLRNFISTAHANNISIGIASETSEFFDKTIRNYNDHQVQFYSEKVDVLNYEFEFWNWEDNDLCATYFNSCPNYPTCDADGLFHCWEIPELQAIRNISYSIIGSNGQHLLAEIYLGFTNTQQMDAVVQYMDRILLHAYRTSDKDVYGYSDCRLYQIGEAALNQQKYIDVAPIFSNEFDFMGPWLLNNNISTDQPLMSYYHDYINDGTTTDCDANSLPGGWRDYIRLVGSQWFTYTDMQSTILFDSPGLRYSCGGNNDVTFSAYDGGGYSFQWNTYNINNGISTPINGATNASYTFNIPTNTSGSTVTHYFTLTYAPSSGCDVTTTRFAIKVYGTGTPPSITPTIPQCPPITLQASGASSYTWLPKGQTSTSISPYLNDTYILLGYDQNDDYLGCSSYDVSMDPNQPKITGSPTTVCEGETVDLTATCTSSGNFEWDNGPQAANYQFTPSNTGNYTVTITAPNGCTNSETLKVRVLSLPVTPSLNSVSVFTCQTATLSVTQTTAMHSYNWYDAPTGGSLLGTGNTFTTPELSTTTTFYVSAVNCITGCESARVPVDVGVSDEPEALVFDGSDDRVTMPHKNNYNLGTGNFTLEARINLDPTATMIYPMIISRREIGNGGFLFGIWNSGVNQGQIFAQLGGRTPNYINNGPKVNDGHCHHVAVMRQGVDCFFYVDGVIYGTFTSGNTLTIPNATKLTVGIDLPNYRQAAFKGVIDEVRFWDKARSGQDILDYMNCSLNGDEAGLIGYWPIWQSAGSQDVEDFSVILNDGVLGDDPTSNSLDPSWTSRCSHRIMNLVVTPNSLPDSLTTDQGFRIYPNPSSTVITIDIASQFSNGEIIIMNQFGAEIKRQFIKNKSMLSLDISALRPGNYFAILKQEDYNSIQIFEVVR